ncbi:sucrose synthase [Phtheirospermum japonicum]|uniref:Sucrose synthase n=1 Tax=Phtheirospermum japonicum TaxID=374723 RepID=A0A830CX40_9LAMI|nr:sucrose synthase [Phtheirospermum japonicum]
MLDLRKSQKLEMVKYLNIDKARYRLEAEIGKSPPLSDEELYLELRHKAAAITNNQAAANSNAHSKEAIVLPPWVALAIWLRPGVWDFIRVNDSFPHIIITPDTSIAIYMSWLPTLEVIREIKVPVVFSNYCDEASLLAVSYISSVMGTAPKIQVHLVPTHAALFRSSLYGAQLFYLGLTMGITYSSLRHKLEIEKLSKSLKQSEDLV